MIRYLPLQHWLALLLLGLVAPPLLAQSPASDPPAAAAAAESEASTSLDEIRRFVSVFRAVKHGYVDSIDDETLMRAAIRGLLLDLDPHSAYLDADQAQALSEAASGSYAGLGLEVVQQPDRSLLVISPIDDTPAARAGIRPGDVITAINDQPIQTDGVDAAVESMRGPVGSEIRLTIDRDGTAEPLQFTLTREIIRTASTRALLLEPGYAYLRISAFQAGTGEELKRKLDRVIDDNQAALNGLILDLRRNPGGLLNAAVEVADAFLDKGVIVVTRGRLNQSRSELSARQGDLIDGAPIVILVDDGTASAAEVLAGALRDNRRALILGTTTFGKGSVQTVLPLDNGDSIKLTTARYYTPSGTSIQATGIVPDVVFEDHSALSWRRGDQPPTVRERDLPGHLRGEHEDAAPAAAQADPQRADELDDPAVREALNLLKGVAIFGRAD